MTSNLQAITGGPDGALWFTETTAGKVGKITTSGSVTEFPVPGHPFAITSGLDGSLWFTETTGRWFDTIYKIGRITTRGEVTEFALPQGADAGWIEPGQSGQLWFTASGTTIGSITTSGTVKLYPLSSEMNARGIGGVVATPDGNVRFTDYDFNGIGTLAPDGKVSRCQLPHADADPTSPAIGSDGALWFAESRIDKIARVVLASLPIATETPHMSEKPPAARPAFHVTVSGTTIPPNELTGFEINMIHVSVMASGIQKKPSDMPAAARYVWYAGKDPKDSDRAIVWYTSGAALESRQARIEQQVATILATLDQGAGGKTLQAIYASTPSGATSRVQLGAAIFDAMQSASDQTAENSKRQLAWVLVHVRAGMTRDEVRKVARSQDLHIYNWDYGGTIARPVAIIEVPGAFSPGCSFHSNVTVTFDGGDRVTKVDTGKPIPSCL